MGRGRWLQGVRVLRISRSHEWATPTEMGEPPPGVGPSMSDTTGVVHVGLRKRHYVVVLLAVLLALVGVVGSVLGADAIAHNNAEKSQQSFKSASG